MPHHVHWRVPFYCQGLLLSFYTAWVVSGLSRTQRAVQAVADFIVATERCKTVRQAVVANINCKNSMSESARLIGQLVANFIVGPQLL